MINAQTWLDKNYPKENRKNETGTLDIRRKNLEGKLNLEGFINLEHLWCGFNQITSLDLSDCRKLKELWFCSNQLKTLDLSNNLELTVIDLGHNPFISFKPFRYLTKLTTLGVNGIKIEDVNYLPDSVESVWDPDSFLVDYNLINYHIKENSYNFRKWREENQKVLEKKLETNWEKKGFNEEEIKEWVDAGVEMGDYELVTYARYKGYQPTQIKQKKLELKKIDEEYEEWKKNLSAQGYLDCFCPKEKRSEMVELIISDQNLIGELNLREFTNLEKLDCSNNKITELHLFGLEKLTEINLKGNSDIRLREKIENLSENCQKIYYERDWQLKGAEISSKYLKEDKNNWYYDLVQWREDKQNSIAEVIPLERLFVIRGNIKQFLKKWGIRDTDNSNQLSELSRLKTLEELWKHRWTIYSTRLIG